MTFDPPWWPEDLGQPSSSGAQNDMRYAFFPDRRRLLIERDGQRTTYDTGTHRIGGVSQQGSHDRSPSFTSQHGPVRLDDLDVVEASGAEPPTGQRGQRQEQSQGWTGPLERQAEQQRAEQQRTDSHRGDAAGRGADRREQPEAGARDRQDHATHEDHAKGRAAGGERVVFTEEGGAARYLKLIACGDIDADMLEALEDFIKRQKRRLAKG